jgi:uncharacterized protein YcbX
MAGERLDSVEIGADGFVGDRVVHVSGPGGRIVSARTHPSLLGGSTPAWAPTASHGSTAVRGAPQRARPQSGPPRGARPGSCAMTAPSASTSFLC